MPYRDPDNWRQLMALVASIWPSLYAAGLAFAVALVRALHAGGRPCRSFLEALLCGFLTLAIVPVLDHLGINQNMAVAIGAAIAFLGTEWFRDRVDSVARRILDKWVGK